MTTCAFLTSTQLLDLYFAADANPEHIRHEYRGKGNWAIYVDNRYVGTYWTG